MNREILIRVWNRQKREMSISMPLPMLAGYLTATYPKLGNQSYLRVSEAKDKNDKEICEGDLVRTLGGGVYTVRFGKYTIEGFYKCEGFYLEEDYTESFENEEFEVIGNIHENPELIPQK